MSVDYRSGLAFGWLVTPEEHNEMVNTCWDYEDDFICVNAYTEDYYVFGIWLHCIGMGTIKEFNLFELSMDIPSDFMGEWGAKLRAMGKGEWFDEEKRLPGIFLIGQVT